MVKFVELTEISFVSGILLLLIKSFLNLKISLKESNKMFSYHFTADIQACSDNYHAGTCPISVTSIKKRQKIYFDSKCNSICSI